MLVNRILKAREFHTSKREKRPHGAETSEQIHENCDSIAATGVPPIVVSFRVGRSLVLYGLSTHVNTQVNSSHTQTDTLLRSGLIPHVPSARGGGAGRNSEPGPPSSHVTAFHCMFDVHVLSSIRLFVRSIRLSRLDGCDEFAVFGVLEMGPAHTRYTVKTKVLH